MRIFQIIQKKQYRGAEIFGAQLSEHLVNSGNEVMMCCIYDGEANLPFSGNIVSLESSKKNRYWDVSGWYKLATIIREFNPDVVQANASDTLKYTVISKLLFRWKAPIVYRNASLSSFYVRNRLTKLVNEFLLRKTDIIVSVSNASKKDLNHLFPFTTNKNIVIPVGIEETGKNGRKEGSSPVRLRQGYKNILHLGSFTSEKNHFELLQIFKRILKQEKEVILNFGGSGPLEPKVKTAAEKLGLIKHVRFLGEVNSPLSLIQQSDVLVLPSLIEGLPGVILEAMHAKTPVVAYDVGGVSEILNKATGYLVPQGDVENFTQSVLQILQETDCSKLENAYNMVQENYKNKIIAKEFLKLYQKIQNHNY